MIYKTYKGARLDLEFYQGKSTIDYEVEVLNDDGSELDFSVFDSVEFKLFYRQHGELVISPTVTTSDNFLELTLTKAQTTALQLREYWYEVYGIFPDDEEELICTGIMKGV